MHTGSTAVGRIEGQRYWLPMANGVVFDLDFSPSLGVWPSYRLNLPGKTVQEHPFSGPISSFSGQESEDDQTNGVNVPLFT
jgi:hypothetical protein